MAATLFDLTGRTALVIGSSKVIGFALASALASAGARVVLNARDVSRFASVKHFCSWLGRCPAVQAFSQSRRLPLPLTGHVFELHREFFAAGIGADDTVALMKQFDGYTEHL